MPYCTHVMYGFAHIDKETFKITPSDEYLDLDTGKGNYHAVTNLKTRYPGIRVLLSVGGPHDGDDRIKYLTLLESQEHRNAFINSARILIRQYRFDGIDLAWGFPEIHVHKDRNIFKKIWHNVKKAFGYSKNFKDDKEEEHRDGFTALVKDLKTTLKSDGGLVTVAVMDNVNASVYFDLPMIKNHIEFGSLMGLNFVTPERSSKEADFSAPLHKSGGRPDDRNADAITKLWLEAGVPSTKIVLGIPTFATTWTLTPESKVSGAPPITADGPGEEGPHTKTPGILSYQEMCNLLPSAHSGTSSVAGNQLLRKVTDPSKKLGTYAFRLPHEAEGIKGLWASYEDEQTAAYKADFVKTKGYGGIAVYDVTLDDFRGFCNGEKFPILKTVRQNL